MLQDIRQNVQGTAAKIIVGLIVISFSIFGIESILVGGGGGGVAEVNGEEISPVELQQAVNTAKRRLIGMMGDNVDPAMLDDERLTPQALEGLIARKLQLQAARDLGLAVSEREVGAIIGGMEQFQIDGTFSAEMYTSMLSQAGYTPSFFKQSLMEDLMINQVRSGLAGSDFATPAELEANAKVTFEQRDLRYLTLPLEKFRQETEVTADDIAAYYEENQLEFLNPETVELDYIELRSRDFYQPVDQTTLQEAYELEKDSYAYSTENRVSHILFERREGESDEQRQARIDEARAALDAGTAFTEVAGQYSDDIGSAAAGGDLGFSSGETFPEPMEEAIAALEVDVVSEPVETEAGIHLILVTERKDAEMPSFEEMAPQLEARLQEQEAAAELLRTVEALRDLSFNSEDLDAPAEELDLTVTQSDAITRNQAEGLFSNPTLIDAAFSEEVLDNGHNSDVIELAGNHFLVLRVRRHQESQVRPLEDVRDDVLASLQDQAARAAVSQEAERIVNALRQGASVEEVANAEDLQWQVELGADRRNANVPPKVLSRAFQLPVPGEGETLVDYVMSATGDALVLELTRVDPGRYEVIAADQQRLLGQQLRAEYGSLLDTEYRGGLRADADINVLM
jgi:peptidyl-prolyl cis-trans isomerase D